MANVKNFYFIQKKNKNKIIHILGKNCFRPDKPDIKAGFLGSGHTALNTFQSENSILLQI